eukprot:GHVN01016350.1.p1 GENE.GHVN01016350.1~~GHVN01016350.1.p1  ORF type:complete len:131 (-),score=2.73 GHVN01016350.1:6-398(-)
MHSREVEYPPENNTAASRPVCPPFKAAAIIKRASRYVGSRDLSTLYKAFVRSRIEKNSHIWVGAPGTQSLDRLQNKCDKIIQRRPGSAPAILQSLRHRRLVSGLCVFYRMLINTAPPALTELLPPVATTN